MTESIKISQVDAIEFGILTAEDVRRLSVCQITNKKNEGPGSVTDLALGTVRADVKCKTCDNFEHDCPGHFGHIELPYPLFIPLFMTTSIQFLRCICHSCFRMRLTYAEAVKRLSLKTFQNCPDIDAGKPMSEWHPQSKYQWFKQLSRTMHGMKRCLHCGTECIKWSYNKFTRRPKFKQDDLWHELCDNLNYTETFGDQWFVDLVERVPREDLEFLGIIRDNFEPSHLVTDVIPVLPIISRPPVEMGGKFYPDALTGQYHAIMKAIVDMRKTTEDRIAFQNRFGTIREIDQQIQELNRSLTPMRWDDGTVKWDEGMEDPSIRTVAEHNLKSLKASHAHYQHLVKDIETKIWDIRFRWGTLAVNKKGECKYSRGKQPIRSIKDRLSGKHGQLRYNLMGKRTDYCARSVATGDPNLDLNEVGVPKSMTSQLTIPVKVTDLNKTQLEDIVNLKRRAGYVSKSDEDRIFLGMWYQLNPLFIPGDRIIRNGHLHVLDKLTAPKWCNRPGDLIETERCVKQIVPMSFEQLRDKGVIPWIKLSVGTTVERFLQDGDYVMLNRYPSLHKMSMMGYRVKTMPVGETLRINLSATSPHNCDFDGDEINIWAVQSEQVKAEMETLCDVKHNIVSAQSNKPVIGLVQEELLGVCKMSLFTGELERDDFCDLAMAGDIELDILEATRYRMKTIAPTLCESPPYEYSTQTLLSCIFPPNFNYEKDDVVIKQGLLLSGVFNKGIVGKARHSLIHVLWKYESHDAAMELIHKYSRMGIQYLIQIGFSVGIEACLPSTTDIVDTAISKSLIRASQPDIGEPQINAALNAVRNVSKRHCESAFKSDNPFLQMIRAGSKGDYFNIFGISGALGQQNVEGTRIVPEFDGRPLPHFAAGDLRPFTRGFVVNNYISGLTPYEFFFHAMSGREGLTDTAIKTSKSGYGQRRMIKLMEDIAVQYDGTVRDKTGCVLQFTYGEDGFTGEELIYAKGQPTFIDVQHIVDELNAE